MSQTIVEKRVKLFDSVTLKYGTQNREYTVVRINTHIDCIETSQYNRGIEAGETAMQIMLGCGFKGFDKKSFWERLTHINGLPVA